MKDFLDKALFFHVDAFTTVPFTGNPAGVCLLPTPREDRWMARVAGEMNAPETVFVERKNGSFSLRWFTPTTEVELCGHATLAASHVLWSEGILEEEEPAKYQTKGGHLSASQKGDWIILDFPAHPAADITAPTSLTMILGRTPKYAGENSWDYLVEVESEEVLRELQPDLTRLSKLPARGLIVTAPSSHPEIDFVSRFFAPKVGIPEDPVTGSAHCCLGPYWKPRLGKDSMIGKQISPRGGIVRVKVEGDRVLLGGKAVTISHGEMDV